MPETTRFALMALAMAASIGGATCVQAQDGHSSAIERQLLACDAIADTSERLACFEGVVDNLKPDKVTAEATAPVEPPVAVTEGLAATSTTAAAVPPAAVDAGAAAASVTVASEIAPANDAPAVAAETSPPPPPADRQAVVSESADEDSDEKDLSGTGAIVRVWQNLDGRFSVELDNGEVWRETEGSRVGMPKVGNAVEVSSAAFGSYLMKIDGIARKARVRRTN